MIRASAINDHRQIAATGCNRTTRIAFRPDPIPDPPTAAVEYHHADFDHYVVIANPDEIAKLDSGGFPAWARTGESVNVHLDAPIGTNATCRFFSTAFASKSSHFYTAYADGCSQVRAMFPAWQFERVVFNIAVPDQDGRCPSNTQPVYRVYNDGQGGAPNHRLTTSLAMRSQMLAAGWVPEGSGPLGVAMCSTQ